MRIWRELLSRRRVAWGLEQVWLLLAAVLSVGHTAWGWPCLGPAAGGRGSQAGGTARRAQVLMHVQGPTPPQQLSLQGLDLLPQGVVVFLQRLVLLVQGVRLVRVLLPAALGGGPVLLFLLQLPLMLLWVLQGMRRRAQGPSRGSGSKQGLAASLLRSIKPRPSGSPPPRAYTPQRGTHTPSLAQHIWSECLPHPHVLLTVHIGGGQSRKLGACWLNPDKTDFTPTLSLPALSLWASHLLL